ncbi:hypothetical protein E1301_Tti003479 [Triplophysa tibetana]|uniref:Restin-like protein n=1 Tax=Triplophysa tibetana TaxID=1572043 RepID=A0A5A9PT28_9TELE|nr:hypothetical protein E1301_Tti003479 [Triplophysa tibetana]
MMEDGGGGSERILHLQVFNKNTMAKNTDMMLRDLTNSPEFVEELLPAAERTALLYHLSYLCLGNFPKLERILRQRAVENQLLFVSSEALLLKCVTTSEDLVSALLPMLRLSVENNQTILAVKALEKAKAWITEIVDRVNAIIERYEKHNYNVASSTSDVITEKAQTEKEKVETSSEIKSLGDIVDKFQDDLKKIFQEIGETETKIQEKNAELQKHVSDICRTSHGLGILAAIVPFIGPLIKSIYDTATAPGNIPDPVHLGEVQMCLSQIQKILIQLQKFWMSVGELLDSLKKKTFVGEDILAIEMNENTKSFFLKSIEIAEEYWKTFGQSCLKAKDIFSLQNKDAYKFLESSPPVDPVEWKQEYESIMEKLKNISPNPLCEANKAAITE